MSIKQLYKMSALVALIVSPVSSVFAGSSPETLGSMTYRIQSATGIPTLSGTMLLVLSLLLLAVAVRVAKQKDSGANKFFIALLGVSALSMGGGGIKLVSDADAVSYIVLLPLPINPGTNSVKSIWSLDIIALKMTMECL